MFDGAEPWPVKLWPEAGPAAPEDGHDGGGTEHDPSGCIIEGGAQGEAQTPVELRT